MRPLGTAYLITVLVMVVGIVCGQTPGEDASPYGPPQTVMMLVETTQPAFNFARHYHQAGAVLVAEDRFPNISRALWHFTANIPQFSLLRASFANAEGASVIATSSRADDEIQAAYATTLWNLDRIDQVTNNYDFQYDPGNGYTGEGVNAYVLDTGVVPDHPDMGGRVSLDFSAYPPQYADDNGHGSHVAGIIGGTTYGVAKKARVRSYKVLRGSTGTGTLAALASALVHIRANVMRPAVINLSLTYDGYDSVVDALLTELLGLGITIVAAAGNSGVDACKVYPCITSGVLCVGATTRSDQRSSFSNYGACVDNFAPGSDIVSLNKDGVGTNNMYGTSMSAPHETGVAILYLQANPYALPAAVANAIIGNTIQGQLLATSLGARSPNRMLFAVWGVIPSTMTLGGITIVTTGTTTLSTATGDATATASTTNLASTTNRVTSTTLASRTTSVAHSTSTLSVRTASLAATSTATGNSQSTTTLRATSTSQASTTSARTTSTRTVTTTRASTTRASTTTRSASTTLSAATSAKTSTSDANVQCVALLLSFCCLILQAL